MAYLYLKARLKPLEIDDKKAKVLKQEWLTDKLPDLVEVEGFTFKAVDLKGIDIFTSNKYQKNRYDKIKLDDVKFRDEIKSFERDFLAWLAKHPELKDDVFSNLKWYQELGAIRLKGSTTDYTMVNPQLYESLVDKWSALQLLQRRRKVAREMQQQAFDAIE